MAALSFLTCVGLCRVEEEEDETTKNQGPDQERHLITPPLPTRSLLVQRIKSIGLRDH